MEHRSPDGDRRPLDDVRRRVVQPTISPRPASSARATWTNEIAAHLVAGKSLPVEQHDAETQPTHVRRRGRPRRSRPTTMTSQSTDGTARSAIIDQGRSRQPKPLADPAERQQPDRDLVGAHEASVRLLRRARRPCALHSPTRTLATSPADLKTIAPRLTMRRYLKPKLIAGAVMASSGRRVCQSPMGGRSTRTVQDRDGSHPRRRREQGRHRPARAPQGCREIEGFLAPWLN